VIRRFIRGRQWRKIIDFHQPRRLRPQARSVKDVVYPFRPAVRITGGLLVTHIRIHEATADEFLHHRTFGLRVQITADDPRICRMIGLKRSSISSLICLYPICSCGGLSSCPHLRCVVATLIIPNSHSKLFIKAR
jgi:hypothetical protein